MAKANSTAVPSKETIATKSSDTQIDELQELRNAVSLIDCLSQGGFSQISSIAKLALSRLETPGGYQHIDDIANALESIWVKADDIQNCINCEAEQVGCNYIDEAERRRWNAQRLAREEAEAAHA